VAREGEIDRPRGHDREARENGIPETAAMIADSGAEYDPAAGCLTQVSPLIGMAPDPAAGTDFLQAGNVGVDFAQHRDDSGRVIASVDTNAFVDVVGYYPNRRARAGPGEKWRHADAVVR